MYFNFCNVDLVKWEKNCLIVDLTHYQTINIDKKYYTILNCLKNGKSIEEITDDTQFLINKLKELESLGVGELSAMYTPKRIYQIC